MTAKTEDIWNVALATHNKIRRIYCLPDLRIDPILHAEADKHAHFLASTSSFFPSKGKWGNMIHTSDLEDKTAAVKEAVTYWVHHCKNCFNFLHPEVNRLGLGVVKNSRGSKWIIVAFYNLPPEPQSEEEDEYY